jgi:hypothetical protein
LLSVVVRLIVKVPAAVGVNPLRCVGALILSRASRDDRPDIGGPAGADTELELIVTGWPAVSVAVATEIWACTPSATTKAASRPTCHAANSVLCTVLVDAGRRTH